MLLRVTLLLFALALSFPATSAEKPFRVALDIGHTPQKPGARSARGIGEYEFNKKMAFAIYNKLKGHKNIEAFIINKEGKAISLTDRTQTAKKNKADLFLSIHHDSVQPHYLKKWTHNGKTRHYSDRFNGYSLFISNKNPKVKASQQFAEKLGKQLNRQGLTPTLHHAEKIRGENRPLLDKTIGLYRFDNLVVLKKTAMPAVLLECGIIVNRQEEQTVSQDEFREKVTSAIVLAIDNYLSQHK